MGAKQSLSRKTQKKLKGQGVLVDYINDAEKYSKQKFAHIYKGYDAFENFGVVRAYIQAKYDINIDILEILLNLMGKKIFGYKEFHHIPRRFDYQRWGKFLEYGYVNLVMDHEKTENRLYTLNTKGRNIIVNFYAYLSGEKKIPEDSKHNPLANSKTQSAFDKKRMQAIKRMNKLEPKAHTQYFFKE